MEDKQLVVFEDDRFGTIRTITDDSGRPWFAGKDVAGSLGYSDTDQAIRKHCKLPKLFKPVELTGLECGPRGMMKARNIANFWIPGKSTTALL